MKSVETHSKLEIAKISKKIKPQKNIVYYKYNKKGHIQRNCPNKNKGEKEDNKYNFLSCQKPGNKNNLKNNYSNKNNKKPLKQKNKNYYCGNK